MEAKASELVNLRKSSPLRPVDWRWRRALILQSMSKEPNRFSDDKFVLAAFKYSKLLDKVEDSWDYVAKNLANEALCDAHQIYSVPDAKLIKWELEARILAKEDINSISSKLCLSTKTIKWYESLFFNVLDRIANQSWIIHAAIGKSLFYGANERDMDVIWKYCGYFFDVEKLDWLVHQKSDSGALVEWAENEIDLNMLRKTYHSSKIVSANSWNQLQLLQMHQKDKEISASTGSLRSSSSDASLLGNFMSAISSVVTTGSQIKDDSELGWVTKSLGAAEPRADEALLIANGNTEVLENLAGITLPEAKADGSI